MIKPLDVAAGQKSRVRVAVMAKRFARGLDIWSGKPLTAKDLESRPIDGIDDAAGSPGLTIVPAASSIPSRLEETELKR